VLEYQCSSTSVRVPVFEYHRYGTTSIDTVPLGLYSVLKAFHLEVGFRDESIFVLKSTVTVQTLRYHPLSLDFVATKCFRICQMVTFMTDLDHRVYNSH
jgi:hypothetical protein